jgi:predicted HTH transcriptional regulator
MPRGLNQSNKENPMTPTITDAVATELKRFAQELNLSESQKEQLKTNLSDKHAKLQEFMRQNPNVSRSEMIQKITSMRALIREQIVKFLTPQQLEKWDTEAAKAKDFLGHRVAS